MKYTLLFLFVIAIFAMIAMFAIAFIIKPGIISPTGFVAAEDKAEDKSYEDNIKELPSFRLYTKAICENATGFVVCHDELFASCGNFEYRLPKNEVNGKGIFDKDWEDPRND